MTEYNLRFYSLRVAPHDPNQSNHLYISKTKYRFDISSFFELKRFVRKNNIRLLHLHLAQSIVYGIFLKLVFIKDLKVIVHEHGQIYQNKQWYRFLLKMFENRIDLFIAVSEDAKNKLICSAGIDADKVKILHNFINLEDFDPKMYNKSKIRQTIGLKDSDYVIGYTGRLVKLKNVDKMIKSVSLVLKKKPNVTLVIIGDGPEKSNLVNMTKKLNIQSNVIFLGYRKDIPKIISAFDSELLISDHESFGIPIIETLAMKKELIATNVGIASRFKNYIKIIPNEDIVPNLTNILLESITNKPKRFIDRDDLKRKYSPERYYHGLNKLYGNLK